MKPDQDTAKRSAAKAAADLIQSGMKVGLGTGSTASYFIEYLAERCRNNNLKIQGFPSSEATAALARKTGIPLCNENTITSLDVTVDGADEVDSRKRLIKGGGGAMLREKIVATMASDMIVVVDEDKLVKKLGGCPLPVEIVPFASHVTLDRIRKEGYDCQFRRTKNNQLYITDNGNYIIDILFPSCCGSPKKVQDALKAIPGVVETGFFLGIAKKIIVGFSNGKVNIF